MSLSVTNGRNVRVELMGYTQELVGAMILSAIQSQHLQIILEGYDKFKDHPATEELRRDYKTRNT